MDMPFVRSPFNYDARKASDESALVCEDVSLAQQHFLEECDINTIVRRFGLTGELPSGVRAPTYGDFTSVGDFQTAVQMVAAANESFDAMPWEVRSRFHFEPSEFVVFCSTPGNEAELKRLGLVTGVPVPAPFVKEVVNGVVQVADPVAEKVPPVAAKPL